MGRLASHSEHSFLTNYQVSSHGTASSEEARVLDSSRRNDDADKAAYFACIRYAVIYMGR